MFYSFQVPVAIPVEDYLSPLYQGWLTKEGTYNVTLCVLLCLIYIHGKPPYTFDIMSINILTPGT